MMCRGDVMGDRDNNSWHTFVSSTARGKGYYVKLVEHVNDIAYCNGRGMLPIHRNFNTRVLWFEEKSYYYAGSRKVSAITMTTPLAGRRK